MASVVHAVADDDATVLGKANAASDIQKVDCSAMLKVDGGQASLVAQLMPCTTQVGAMSLIQLILCHPWYKEFLLTTLPC